MGVTNRQSSEGRTTTMKILCAVPNRDFDPTEASVPWRRLKDEGHTFTFATPDGTKAAADPHMIRGKASTRGASCPASSAWR
jgi:putative intracellular protease/amidase